MPFEKSLIAMESPEEGLTRPRPARRQALDRVEASFPVGSFRRRPAAACPPRRAAAGPNSSAGGAAAADGASSADTTRGLSGAEWRAAAKAAGSKARRRPAGSAQKAAAVPLPATGARLATTARCLRGCDWTAGPGDPAEVDKAAEKHTRTGHPTTTVSEPTGDVA